MSRQVTTGYSGDDGHGSAKREAILSEAATLFNEQGYHDTRLRDVADRLGVVKTTISYHFRSKEALLLELYEQSCDAFDADLEPESSEENGFERLVGWLHRSGRRQRAALIGEGRALVSIRDINGLGNTEQERIQRRIKVHMSGIRTLLAAGVEDGSISVQSLDASSLFFFGMQSWIANWLANSPRTDERVALQSLIDLVAHGLATRRDWQPRNHRAVFPEENASALFDREERSRMKRDAFLRAGIRALNSRGFRNLSLQEVAADLGVSRSAFYYYFSDKDALLQACVGRTLDVLENGIDLDASYEGLSALERLTVTLRSVFDAHRHDYDPLVRVGLLNALEPAQRAVAEARFRRIAASFGKRVADGMVDGSIRPVRVKAVEHVLLGALLGADQRHLRLTDFDLADGQSVFVSASTSASLAYFQPLLTGVAAREH